MSPDAQRIAIAEACGWKTPGSREVIERTKNWVTRDSQQHFISPDGIGTGISALPDYLTDLNAMHEAEKVFKDDEIEWQKYANQLYRITEPHRHILHATAAQRAEAFLHTIGKWEDAK